MYLTKNNKNYFKQQLNFFYNSKTIRLLFKPLILPFFFLKESLERNKLQLSHLEIPVGSKCSLHCKKCANLMQYYKKPFLVETKALLDDIKSLLELNIEINQVNLIGGEPFLHKDLPQFIRLLKQSPKVKTIRIITNGTIIPTAELLQAMAIPKLHIFISNYSMIGTKINEVYAILKKNNIQVAVTSVTWYDYQHNFKGYNRTEEEKRKIYHQCDMDCHEMLNGEIHLCPTSAHGMYLGLIPKDENSFVSIRHDHTSNGKRIVENKLKHLLCHQVPNACEYCSGNNGNVIPAAEQLPPCTYLDKNGSITQK